jgi:hypothetical protein
VVAYTFTEPRGFAGALCCIGVLGSSNGDALAFETSALDLAASSVSMASTTTLVPPMSAPTASANMRKR